MSYQILLDERALIEWGKLPQADYEAVQSAILTLRREPRPLGSLKLVERDSWHWRVGRYRLVYEVDDERQEITVLGIRPRFVLR